LSDTNFVFIVITAAAILFASNRVRLDVVALLTVLALMLGRVLTPGEALAGFGDPVVLLVAGLLVVGEMLDRTGVAQFVGAWILQRGGGSETRLLVLIMLAAGILSSVMSSTAVVAIFIPIVLKIATKTGLNPSRILMPMSYAALISGMLTLIATPPNLVVSGELENAGFEPLGFFSFFPIGVVVLFMGIGYFLLYGRRLLATREDPSIMGAGRTIRDLWIDFGLNERVHRLRVSSRSPLSGTNIGDADIEKRYRVRVLGLERQGGFGEPVDVLAGEARAEMLGGDVLLVMGESEEVALFADMEGLDRSSDTERDRQRRLQALGVGVVLIHPECRFIGKNLREAELRSRYGVDVLGVRRGKKPLAGFVEKPLHSADTLLVAGPWKQIRKLREEAHDFVLLELPVEFEDVRPAARRAPIALAILAGMVLLSVLGVVPIVTAVLLAALAAVSTRCLTMEDAYRSIHLSSLVLLAGMLPVADALEKTGGMELVVGSLVSSPVSDGPYALMTGLFFITAGLSLFLSNTASAVLMAPVAIHAARVLGVSPYPFAVVVLIAASAGFATPISSPVVTLVVEPGRYRFVDFVKVGIPLLLLTYVAALLLTPVLFPL
jgi:di/tricarboxylate transporter